MLEVLNPRHGTPSAMRSVIDEGGAFDMPSANREAYIHGMHAPVSRVDFDNFRIWTSTANQHIAGCNWDCRRPFIHNLADK